MKVIIIIIVIACFHNHFSQSLVINEIMSSNSNVFADEDGDFSDWIEIVNISESTINLNNFSISDDDENIRKWIFPDINIEPQEYLIIFASDKDKIDEYLHTNFKIDANGEILILTNNFGEIIDQLTPVEIPSNISFGKSNSDWLYFTQPTPGSPNSSVGYSDFAENPTFSLTGGFYSGQIFLELTSGNENSSIYFTTDGSDPTENSTLYSNPIAISSTTVIRAKVFVIDFLPRRIITNTYFFNENITLPVVSLSTTPANFFDEEIGIYVEGNGTIPNYQQDWERPIHIEFFESDGVKGFGIDAGVQIHGGSTREYPQKSLAIVARGEYGYSTIPYKIFNNLPYDEYNSILLRMSGDDIFSTHFRDAMMHTLVESLDIEKQAFKPAVVFLNGEYWGVYNIRERINKDYIAQHHENVDEDNIDLLKVYNSVVEGDAEHYLAMYDFIENNDLSFESNYNYISTQMDVDNYIKYMTSEMYFANTDWYPGNMKYWRPRTVDGKWRWILYDTDFGFNLFDPQNVYKNMINFVSSYGSPPALIFRKLILNQTFKTKFINAFADFANTIFSTSVVQNKIDSIKALVEPEMLRQYQKWGDSWMTTHGLLFWNNNVSVLYEFATNRLDAMYGHYVGNFNLGSTALINLQTNNNNFGEVKINSIIPKEFPWTGKYFQGVPVALEAIPKPGYIFTGWSGSISSNERIISYTPTSTNNIIAEFQLDNNIYPIVINEINYNPPDTDDPKRTDWIELYNNSNYSIDLSGWKLKDENKTFNFPIGTILNGKNFIVIANSFNVFQTYYPAVMNVVNEDSQLGLDGGGEEISLYSLNGILIDTLEYDDKSPWPKSPDGNGPTLELKHPDLDNTIEENWSASTTNYGTPGEENSSLQYKSSVNLKIYLEGAYISANIMNNSASQISSFPLLQPFGSDPWNYLGNEKIEQLPNSSITDWVLVELREEINSNLNVVRRAALLNINGQITDLDGVSNLSFYGLEPKEYYVAVYHRNHLSVISSGRILIE